MAVDLGTGTTVTFTGFTYNLLSAEVGEIVRKSIETSYMGTTVAQTFVNSDLYDPGYCTLTVQYDATISPPITGTAATMTFAVGGIAVGPSFSAYLEGFTITIPMEELNTAVARFKITGAITFDTTP